MTPCHCSAYPFPHRLSGGKCEARCDSVFCGDCGQPCYPKQIDEGIGAYEYGGAPGVDIRIVTVSDCCEALVYQDSRLTKPLDY